MYHIKRTYENKIPGLREILLPQPCPLYPEAELAEELNLLGDVPAYLFRDKQRYAHRLKTYRDILKEVGPDVVHAHWLYQYGLHGVLASRGIAPFVQSVWGSDVLLIPLFIQESFGLLQYVLSNADMVLGNSRTLINAALGFLDSPPPPSYLFKWGVEPIFNPALYHRETLREKYGFGQSDVIILSARGFKPVYNIRTVIRAFEQARQTFPQLRLILLGRGYGWEEYHTKESPACRVMETGSHELIAELMAISEISISIPFSDSMANTLVESLAMGLYLVASRLPAAEEYLENDIQAKLVNPYEVDEVSAAICGYFTEPGLHEKMKAAGRSVCREFSEEKALQDVRQVYETVRLTPGVRR